jgi:hypothetical protein
VGRFSKNQASIPNEPTRYREVVLTSSRETFSLCDLVRGS